MKYLLRLLASYYWRKMRIQERVKLGSQTEGTYWSDCVNARRKAIKYKNRAERLERWCR